MTQRILIVDDEREIRELQAEYLVARGYEVATAASGAEALRLLQDRSSSLISPLWIGRCRAFMEGRSSMSFDVMRLTLRCSFQREKRQKKCPIRQLVVSLEACFANRLVCDRSPLKSKGWRLNKTVLVPNVGLGAWRFRLFFANRKKNC